MSNSEFKFYCSHCDQPLKCDPCHAGRQIQCPACQHLIRIPNPPPGFRLDLGETHARRRIGDADEMLAGRTLNLPSGELWFALQGLIAVLTIELKLGCVHKLLPHHAQTGPKKYMEELFILFAG